jgi:hypothetical protein
MKTKRTQFNIHATIEDLARMKKLREKHGISISGVFKVFLNHLEQQLKKIDYKSGVKKAIKND